MRLITHRSRRQRSGFTLIEMLGVVFTICMLITMLLPAIQQSRESARHSSCLRNLAQLGLALSCYHDSFNCMPSGTVNEVGPIQSTPDGYHMSWLVQILPQLEYGTMFSQIDFRYGVYADENLDIHQLRLASMQCSSSFRASRLWKSTGQVNYAACHNDVEAPIDVDQNGVFFLNSSVSHDDILDGLSQTVLVGEKLPEPGLAGWMSGTRSTLRNTDTPGDSAMAMPVSPTLPDGSPDPAWVGGFDSLHNGGMNFLWADGAARQLGWGIDRSVYQALGHRRDGRVIPEVF